MNNNLFKLLVLILLFAACGEEKQENKEATMPTAETVQKQFVPKEKEANTTIKPEKIDLNEIAQHKKNLKGDFDSVLFFTKVDSIELFYVAKGNTSQFSPYSSKWENTSFKIGVIDKNSQIIIPIEYHKILNPNSFRKNCMVAEKNNKYTLFSLSGEQFFPAIYDDIFPSDKVDVLAQYRKGTNYGWIDLNGNEHQDNTIGKYPELGKMPLSSQLVFNWKISSLNSDYIYAEDNEQAYTQFMFAPPYLTNLGISNECFQIASDFSGDQGITDYSTSIQKELTFGEKLKAIVVYIAESGIDPRDGYTNSKEKLLILNDNLKATSSLELSYEDSPYRFIGDTLIELVNTKPTEDYDNNSEPIDLPEWEYYKIKSNGQLEKLKCIRKFPFTKFVKMDNSYFKIYYEVKVNQEELKNIEEEENPDGMPMYYVNAYHHLTIEDLDLMRNEIFASYGYKFKTKKWQDYFAQKNWYKPLYDNVDNKLLPIEKENISLILKMKKQMTGHEQDFVKKEIISKYIQMAG